MRKFRSLAITAFLVGVMTVGIGYVASDAMVIDSMSPLSLTDMQNKYGGCARCNFEGPYDCPDTAGHANMCEDTYETGTCQYSTTELCTEWYHQVCTGMYCEPIYVPTCDSY